MNFWTMVLASMVGYFAFSFITSLIRIIYNTYLRVIKEKTRKIGFGESKDIHRKAKENVQMRKIGFGAND